MSDLRDFTGKNRAFTGAKGIKTSSDGLGTGDRVDEKGRLRFNDTTDLLEYYNGADWKSVDAPPVVTGFTINDIGGSSVTSSTIDNEADSDATIEVLGSLFDTTGATVSFVSNNETLSPATTTRNNANKITVTIDPTGFDLANSPYNIKVTNGSGLSAELQEAITADSTAPTFTNAADTTFVMFDTNRAAGIAAGDLCGASNATSYAVQSGSLPTGLTLNTSTGAITGTANAESSDTTYTFTIRATGDDATTDRQFKITVKAPVVTAYNSTGGFTFSVPSAISSVKVLVVGGGGGTGGNNDGGGGGGGMIDHPSFPVTPGGNVSGNVGGGGSTGGQMISQPGGNSTFGSLTALGGGGGESWQNGAGQPGGSGGGAAGRSTPTSNNPGGIGIQPNQPGDSGTYGYGNPGGNGAQVSGGDGGGGGGGGAGNAGTPAPHPGNQPNGIGGAGGQGRVSNVSGSPVYYAGGGGGGGGGNYSGQAPGGQGGGGNGANGPGQNDAQNGTNNRGGGAGGQDDTPAGKTGGSGVVIVSF